MLFPLIRKKFPSNNACCVYSEENKSILDRKLHNSTNIVYFRNGILFNLCSVSHANESIPHLNFVVRLCLYKSNKIRIEFTRQKCGFYSYSATYGTSEINSNSFCNTSNDFIIYRLRANGIGISQTPHQCAVVVLVCSTWNAAAPSTFFSLGQLCVYACVCVCSAHFFEAIYSNRSELFNKSRTKLLKN